MNLGILLIGDELLDGSIKDINATYFGKLIQDKDIKVVETITVGDNINNIKEAYGFIKKKCSVVIVSGGLGPTPDDRTRFALSEFYNFEPVYDGENFKIIEKYFSSRNRIAPESNKVQSYKPLEFSWVENKNGTASGLTYNDGETTFYSLPGVPLEFSYMIENVVLPEIEQNFKVKTDKINRILMAGIGESTIYDALKHLKESNEISYLPNAENGVLIKYKDKHQIIKDTLIEKLNDNIVSFDGSFLEYNIVKELKQKGITLSLAESCTGGTICGKLTSVVGASEVIAGGVNCYMTSVKTDVLKVNKEIIKNFGVVSKECAQSLSKNIKEIFNSTISVSVTGYLGPNGGDEFASIGTVFVAVSTQSKTESFAYTLAKENREFNKMVVVQYVMHNILKLIRDL